MQISEELHCLNNMPAGEFEYMNNQVPAYLPITGNPNLMRDTRSHGIVSSDRNGPIAIKAQRQNILNMKKGLVEAQNQIQTLKQDLDELKKFVYSSK
jgi:hypothetical protein